MIPGIATPVLRCTRCGDRVPLAPAPFCVVCLLSHGEPDAARATVGAHGPHLPVGTRVGRYEIVELLGEGGFAEVYSALSREPDLATDKQEYIALKIIKRGMDSREILARFRAEHRTIQAFSHPGIVQLREAGATADGLPYFAMAHRQR